MAGIIPTGIMAAGTTAGIIATGVMAAGATVLRTPASAGTAAGATAESLFENFLNNSLAFVELEMKAAGFLDFATDLHNPDFAKMAEAAGLLGLTAETPEQVRPMLVQALKHDGPALVEVVVNRQELAMPPSIQLDQMMAFSLYSGRRLNGNRIHRARQYGTTMAWNMARAGHWLTVYNRTRSRADELRAEGARVAVSPHDVVLNADVLTTMLANDEAGEGFALARKSGVEVHQFLKIINTALFKSPHLLSAVGGKDVRLRRA
jgi:6-phosphogluconate dehydrogenase-like protein/thiamine pyrophosphate-dependent enzyme